MEIKKNHKNKIESSVAMEANGKAAHSLCIAFFLRSMYSTNRKLCSRSCIEGGRKGGGDEGVGKVAERCPLLLVRNFSRKS